MPGAVVPATGYAPRTSGEEDGVARILVVDDEEDNRDMLARRLERKGFAVVATENGHKAIELVGRQQFDLILLDIMMPTLSGIEVLKLIRQTHPATELPIIMATARGEREDIVEAISLGANDYVTKPMDFPVVLARVQSQLAHKRAVDRIVALEADLKQRNVELERVNARMRHELRMAARLQQALLPQVPPNVQRARFEWLYHPCAELAGDIFNVFPLGQEHIGFYLLDVSGHGVPAALLSVTLSRLLTPLGDVPSLVQDCSCGRMRPASPVAVVEELNRRFQMDSTSQYFTILYGVLDLRDRVLRYVNAGHQPAAYLPAAGDKRLLEHYGFAVGWMADGEFEEHTLAMQPGDRLFIYSDGITEAADGSGELFGHERLLESLSVTRGFSLKENLQGLAGEVALFHGAEGFDDDISAIGIEICEGDGELPRT